jgi:molybdopterin converting factor small subunit
MDSAPNTEIRMFGFLHSARKAKGLEPKVRLYIPPEGRVAQEIAEELELPMDKIEGVFINHFVYALDHVIHAGDEVAFVSSGVPGPHRLSLGIHSAGKGCGRS